MDKENGVLLKTSALKFWSGSFQQSLNTLKYW